LNADGAYKHADEAGLLVRPVRRFARGGDRFADNADSLADVSRKLAGVRDMLAGAADKVVRSVRKVADAGNKAANAVRKWLRFWCGIVAGGGKRFVVKCSCVRQLGLVDGKK
jgi:hypothetical protein